MSARRLAFVLLLFLSAPAARADILESVGASVLIVGSNYADYRTTKDAFARGAHELNPVVNDQKAQ
jgi:hypothetical protein